MPISAPLTLVLRTGGHAHALPTLFKTVLRLLFPLLKYLLQFLFQTSPGPAQHSDMGFA